jgi:hypothetical protein
MFTAVAAILTIASVTTSRFGSVPSISRGGALSPTNVSNSRGLRCSSLRFSTMNGRSTWSRSTSSHCCPATATECRTDARRLRHATQRKPSAIRRTATTNGVRPIPGRLNASESDRYPAIAPDRTHTAGSAVPYFRTAPARSPSKRS